MSAGRLDADVLVVGGGTTGLYLASRLTGSRSVTVMEAAGPAPQLLGPQPSTAGHRGVVDGWASGLGGTSTRWGGQLWPWQQWETEGGFERRRWPVDFGRDISPHYRAVLRNLGLPTTHERVHTRSTGDDRLAWPRIDGLDIRYSTWMSRRDRNMATNARVQARLRCADIRPTVQVRAIEPTSSCMLVRTADADGRIQDLRAGLVVLAAGTIGTSRVLRASDLDRGNGAGFADHVSARVARLRVVDWSRFRRIAAQKYVRGVRASARIAMGADTIARGGTMPAYAHFELASRAGTAADLIARRLRGDHGAVRGGPADLVAATVRDAPRVLGAAAVAARRRERPLDPHAEVFLRVDVEQPMRDSARIRWTRGGADPSLDLQWSVGDEEVASALHLRATLLPLLESTFGVRVEELLEPRFEDIFHMMGGTRMRTAGDPGGVVDSALRVGGDDRLRIVGASVFPSGGMANPTFTALALTDRLGDELA